MSLYLLVFSSLWIGEDENWDFLILAETVHSSYSQFTKELGKWDF